ncbi:MAG: FMN-binding protein [Chloroflexota bacterium]|nr:FMN-binding protein [Chloroflexota bacterium]
MIRLSIQRSFPPLAMALMAAVPIGTALSTTHAATLERVKAATGSKTFKGSIEDMQQWGQIRVSIVVKNKTISKVKVQNDYHTGRSLSIQSQAIPMLRQETLQAQSAHIDTISGATNTSDAYITSLQAAVKAAKHAKDLKK